VRSVRVGLAVLLAACTVVVVGPSVSAGADPDHCTFKPGGTVGAVWPQRRLDFQQVWGITQGAGITVAVVDSGVNFGNPQMARIKHRAGVSVIPKFDRQPRDCTGHGTGVAGIIAAAPLGNQTFLGVAPDVTIVPIKQTNTLDDHSGSSDGIAAGIRAALAAHAQVINISVVTYPPTPALRQAVEAARAKGTIIVAAAGNDGQQTTTVEYPAAYSTTFDNVIAVSGTDSNDAIADFSSAGGYVTVAAPGKDVPVPSSLSGYDLVQGTSFAAPYVTGTVALMLSANLLAGHRPLTALQVRNRIEATADAPPADVPDRRYGYGIVNPYLAVTSVQDDAVAAPRTARPAPLPAPQAGARADHDLQHLALGLAFGLVGLAVLALIAAGILRGGGDRRPAAAPIGEPDSSEGTLVRR
jgi:membrane-anchored mycosin MYCP